MKIYQFYLNFNSSYRSGLFSYLIFSLLLICNTVALTENLEINNQHPLISPFDFISGIRKKFYIGKYYLQDLLQEFENIFDFNLLIVMSILGANSFFFFVFVSMAIIYSFNSTLNIYFCSSTSPIKNLAEKYSLLSLVGTFYQFEHL